MYVYICIYVYMQNYVCMYTYIYIDIDTCLNHVDVYFRYVILCLAGYGKSNARQECDDLQVCDTRKLGPSYRQTLRPLRKALRRGVVEYHISGVV